MWGIFLPLNGAVFWWFGNCFLVTFEEVQPYCNRKSRGPHGKIFWDYFSLANCEFVFHVSFSHSNSIGSFDIDGAGLLGFIWFFSSSLLISLRSPPPPHLLLCPSHSLQPTPPSSPLPSYMYPACPPLISPLVGWCRDRHWTVNLTPEEIMTRGRKLIMIN